MQLKSFLYLEPSLFALQSNFTYHFDHSVAVLPLKISSSPSSSLSFIESEAETSISDKSEGIVANVMGKHDRRQLMTSNSKKICMIVYKFGLEVTKIKHFIESQENINEWKAEISEYDYEKLKGIKHKFSKESQKNYETQKWLAKDSYAEETYVVDLKNKNEDQIRLYFLPFNCQTSNNIENQLSMGRAVHSNFKFLQILKQYISLDSAITIFQEKIFKDFTKFLYQNSISTIQMYINFKDTKFDQKIIRKIGQIRLPQEWLEKPEYRSIKQDIYQMRMEEYTIMKKTKTQKMQFLAKISVIQSLLGMEINTIDDISLDNIKKIKKQNIPEKVNQIKELQNTKNNLDHRLKAFKMKKQEYQTKIKSNQEKQTQQISELKNTINKFKIQNGMSQGSAKNFIFDRTRDSNSSFASTNKLKKSNLTFRKSNISIRKSTNKIKNHSIFSDAFIEQKKDQTQPTDKILKIKQNQNEQFMYNSKKIANVVNNFPINSYNEQKALLDKFYSQTLEIDFQIQRELEQRKSSYKNAAIQIGKFLQDCCDQMMI